MQIAARTNDPKAWKKYVEYSTDQISQCSIRGLLRLNTNPVPVPLDEVEPAAEIVKRFVTGAMSLAHLVANSLEFRSRFRRTSAATRFKKRVGKKGR